MTTLYVVQSVLENRVTSLHNTILLVKSREELIKKLSDRYNQFKIYDDYIEEAVPQNILDIEESDVYEVESYAYNKCRLMLQVYDKVELP